MLSRAGEKDCSDRDSCAGISIREDEDRRNAVFDIDGVPLH